MNGDIEKIYLIPGEFFYGQQPRLITTVLGSCVALTMFHRSSGLAAICHALQPYCPDRSRCDASCREQYKYVACVIASMAKKFRSKGHYLPEIETKLFGGAIILGGRDWSQDKQIPVGRQNVEAAMEAIVANGLKLKVADVGGGYGRKIIFDTSTGHVYLKRLGKSTAKKSPSDTDCRERIGIPEALPVGCMNAPKS